MKAVKCPVCDGAGTCYAPPDPGSTSAVGTHLQCHGCGGKGWVQVEEDDEVIRYDAAKRNWPTPAEWA